MKNTEHERNVDRRVACGDGRGQDSILVGRDGFPSEVEKGCSGEMVPLTSDPRPSSRSVFISLDLMSLVRKTNHLSMLNLGHLTLRPGQSTPGEMLMWSTVQFPAAHAALSLQKPQKVQPVFQDHQCFLY